MGRRNQFDRMLTKAYLQHAYVVGKQTSYAIAKKVGCSNVTVLNYLRTYDIEIRRGSDAQILDARYSKVSGSDKATKARALGVKIMTADEFKSRYKV